MKKGREYHGCGEEYTVVKWKRGSNIIFPLILRNEDVRKIIRWGKGMEISGEKIKI